MASPISTVSQLVAVIRAQLSAQNVVKPANARATANKTGKAEKAAGQNAGTYSVENLESLLVKRIGGIDRQDPNRGRKAFRVFLESILLSHFGEHLINDPKFYQLVDDIQVSMESDDEIRRLVDSAIDHLMSGNPE